MTSSTAPPAAQTGFQVNGVYYDVSATVGFSGPHNGDVAVRSRLRRRSAGAASVPLRNDLSSWIDVTTGVDTINHTVSGQGHLVLCVRCGPAANSIFGGFGQPLKTRGISVFKLGQIVPVKFQLKDALGNLVTNAVARIYIAKVVNGVPGAERPGTSTSVQGGQHVPIQHVSDINTYSTWRPSGSLRACGRSE